MGTAHVTCVSGCTCPLTPLNATDLFVNVFRTHRTNVSGLMPATALAGSLGTHAASHSHALAWCHLVEASSPAHMQLPTTLLSR